jgi:hypothetical protein
MKSSDEKLIQNKGSFWVLFIIGFAVLPFLYGEGIFSIGDINMLGRYMSFAILALGLGLLFFAWEPMQWVCISLITEVPKELSMQTGGKFLPVSSWSILMMWENLQEMLWFPVFGSHFGIFPLL